MCILVHCYLQFFFVSQYACMPEVDLGMSVSDFIHVLFVPEYLVYYTHPSNGQRQLPDM